jgi:2-keto-3-deoxy-L-rhamnonate aldolase RhmA
MVPQLGMRPTPARELNPRLDEQVIVQMLLETPLGIANADAIAAVEGVDMLAIGANDLTAELGVPGDSGHPGVRAAVERAGAACARHGKLLMLGGTSDPDLLALACPLRLTGFDNDLLFIAAAARVEALSA